MSFRRFSVFWIAAFSLLAGLTAFAQNTIVATPQAGIRTVSRFDLPQPPVPWFPVKVGGKWGYADTSGTVRIAPQFDAANSFISKVAVVELDKKAYAIDTTGKILTPGFDQLFQLDDTIFSIYLNTWRDTMGGWGITSLSGNLILPPAYDEIYQLTRTVFGFRNGKSWGYVSRSGMIIAPAEYDSAYVFDFTMIVLKKKDKLGLVGMDGKRYLSDEYERIYRPGDRLIAARRDGRWGAVDQDAKTSIPWLYDTLLGINRYFTQAKIGDSVACYFWRNPGFGTPCVYKAFTGFDRYWVKCFTQKILCGVYDTTGQQIIPAVYTDVLAAGNGLWLICDTAKKWGLLSRGGEELLAPRFTRIQPFRGKVTVAFNEKLQCLINDKGEILVPAGDQQIVIRENTVKVFHPGGTTDLIEIDADGRIAEQNKYDKLRTIKVGGKYQPPQTGGGRTRTVINRNNTGLVYVAPGDSLNWFFESQSRRWGMRNIYTGDTLVAPVYTSILRCQRKMTIVYIDDTVAGPIWEGNETFIVHRCGLVNDSIGKLVIKPKLAWINPADFFPRGFYGCVRAMTTDSRYVLIKTDGSEIMTPFSWVDNVSGGYARFCVGGKWSVEPTGEAMGTLGQFVDLYGIDRALSFVKSSQSREFFAQRIFHDGGLWGYVDSTGKIVIAAQYQREKQAFKKTVIVKKDKKWGMLDTAGTVLVPFEFDNLSYISINGKSVVSAQKFSPRFGYVDTKGNFVIPADLRQAKELGNGLIGFTHGLKWGIMDSTGKIICPETYHEILEYSDGLALVRLGKKWGYVDTKGTEVIPVSYEKATAFSHGQAAVLINKRWGYINAAGSLSVEAKYFQAAPFNGISFPVKTKDGYGLISPSGKWLMKPSWESMVPLENSNLLVIRKGNLYGLCRPDGKVVLYPRFDHFRALGEGVISYRSNLYWGLVDTSGYQLTHAIFDKVMPFSEGYAAASQNSLWGYILPNGHFALAPKYRSAGPFSENLAYVMEPKMGGCIIDTSWNIVFKLNGGMAKPFSDGKCEVIHSERGSLIENHFFMTRDGVRVSRLQFEDAGAFVDGVAPVCLGKQWGLISFSGYYMMKPRFNSLGTFNSGIARVQMRTKTGLFTMGGQQVLPVEYDYVSVESQSGLVRFDKGNAVGYLFPDGRMCWPESE